MQLAKPKAYQWQRDYGTLSLSMLLSDLDRLNFLCDVTGITKSKMARGLVRRWIDQVIGVNCKLTDLQAEWAKFSAKEKRDRRNSLKTAFYDYVKCENEESEN